MMMALEAEVRLPLEKGEGPVGIVLCPSVCSSSSLFIRNPHNQVLQRELASQTHENVLAWAEALKNGGYPALNTLLCIGGISMAEQSHVFNKGIHLVIATPGRLIDLLEKKRFNFDSCKYLCMDEADRMIDLGFEDDVRNIMSFFKVCMSFPALRYTFIIPRPLASTADIIVLGDDAEENPRLCAPVTDPSNTRQRRSSWCRKSRRASGCRICETGGQDGVLAGVSAEDATARNHI